MNSIPRGKGGGTLHQSALFILAALTWGSTPIAFAADLKPPPPNSAQPVNYVEWFNKTIGGSIEDDTNAAEVYSAAWASRTGLYFNGSTEADRAYPWSSHPEVRGWLAANKSDIELFRQAAIKRECYFPLHDAAASDMDDFMANSLLRAMSERWMSGMRYGAKALLAQGYCAWEDGDRSPLPQNCLLVLRSSHHLLRGPDLIDRLVGISNASLAYKGIQLAMQRADDPGALATRLLPGFEAADPAWPPLSQTCMPHERLVLIDICQRLFWFAEGADKRQLPWQSSRLLTGLFNEDVNLANKIIAIGYEQTLTDIDAYFDAIDDWSRTPYYLAARRIGEIERLRTEHGNPMIRVFAASLVKARELDDRSDVLRSGTHLLLHLFAWKHRTGTFPQTLDELEIPSLAQLRVDPFSGRDLVYRRQGESFLLYTVALNLKDDGGQADCTMKKGDFPFWPLWPEFPTCFVGPSRNGPCSSLVTDG